jgi:hypothetical protein
MIELRRTILTLVLAVIVLMSALVGIEGMIVAAKSVFGIELDRAGVPLSATEILVGVVLLEFGTLLGGLGAIFLIALPLAFRFPELCKVPNWMTRNRKQQTPNWMRRFLYWYADELKKFTDRIDA